MTTLPAARLVRALLLATVAAACCAAPAFATVIEPNGLAVPLTVNNGEIQLSTYFSGIVQEPLSFTADAHAAPATFYLLPGGTITLGLHQANAAYALAWYNAGAGLTPPSGSDLHTLIPGGAPVPTSVSTDLVRTSPDWAGGPVGLALVGGQTHYTEARFNQVCLTCSPPAPWAPAVVYRSPLTAGKFYVAFEDGTMTSSAFNNDGDFNDDVYALTGVGAACQDTVDNDGDGKVDAADRGCYSGPGGTYAPTDDTENDDPPAPAVALDAPASDATTLSARIVSQGTGRAACAFRLDGGAPLTASIDASATPARCTAAAPTGLAAGPHALTVTYTETAGTTAQDAGTLTISAPKPVEAGTPATPAGNTPAASAPVVPASATTTPPPAVTCHATAGFAATVATAVKRLRVLSAEIRQGTRVARRVRVGHGHLKLVTTGLAPGTYQLRVRARRGHGKVRTIYRTFVVCA